ncbi:MAG TPA: DUF5777 family beta-barrel protein [Bacteroidia bacterium]|jgi:hypothetical protein|nr:DUF5777 family beta-barrel protein [Bacteroidia bacterium]
MKKILSLLVFASAFFLTSFGQDSLADATVVKPKKKVKATFNSSHIINMHSVEIVPKGNLQFMIAHHFGVIWNKEQDAGQNLAQVFGFNSGIAHTYLSFDYSPANFANVGFALTGNSMFEGWAKFKILKQAGKQNSPVSIGWISLVNIDAQSNPVDTIEANKMGWNKFTYMHQLMIARKFSKSFSLQIMPTYIHYNIVPYGMENSNDIFSLGMGAKYQLSPNKALTFEYSHQFNMYENVITKTGNIVNYEPNLLSLGLEFNTGGHVFQFFVGNTTAATNIEQLTRNTNFIKDGKFALGFRLNRSFYLGKKE